MSISSDGAMALLYACRDAGVEKQEIEPQQGFDRSRVFMVMKQNFDGFTRLTVVMNGGHRFEIDSNKVEFSVDMAADWLVGEI